MSNRTESVVIVRAVGFWRMAPAIVEHCPPELRDLPDPKALVDPGWELADRPRIVGYLQSGTVWNRYLGYSWCRFDGGPPPKQMGTADLCDGAWLWPEGLHVYVGQYHVRLPDEFVDHMRRHGFQVPAGLSKAGFPEHAIDLEYWKNWCAEQAALRGA